MTTPLFSVHMLGDSRIHKEEKSGPPRPGQKSGLHDNEYDEDNEGSENNEEAHSHTRTDSDDLHFQPKACQGRSSRCGKQHHRAHRYSPRSGQVRGHSAKVHNRQHGG
jgi:hypothetical protein